VSLLSIGFARDLLQLRMLGNAADRNVPKTSRQSRGNGKSQYIVWGGLLPVLKVPVMAFNNYAKIIIHEA
jgi:hypothetical protein